MFNGLIVFNSIAPIYLDSGKENTHTFYLFARNLLENNKFVLHDHKKILLIEKKNNMKK